MGVDAERSAETAGVGAGDVEAATGTAAGVGAGHVRPGSAPTASPELTPAQLAMDERDWTFGGTWPYEPHWLFTDGIRLHYVDEGPRDGEPVVMLHGNPTWAYLYRHFIRALAGAGYRAIAHDQLGFGRSDKPIREREYSVQRHASHFAALAEELALDGVTLVVQDWGGPIGLSWAVDNPARVRRLVLLNTWPGGATADYPRAPGPFKLLRAPLTGDLLVKGAHLFVRVFLLKGGTRPLDENARQAYLAPHPSWQSRAGVLAYPRLIPWDEHNPTRPLGRHNEEGLGKLADKPVLILWPTKDRGFKHRQLADWRERFPQAEIHEIEAGHYIQEDAHEQAIPLLLDFLSRT
jgi:pimeloyl-ACP methyl ester carboxylesterase